MICPACLATNADEAEACFTCGKALSVLTRGAVLASRYVIREPLGQGGMGRVYRAYDRALDDDVAIKVIRAGVMQEAEMQRRFRSEVRLARRVAHRNVCRIFEYGEDGPIRYLAMEYVEGLDLKRWMARGPLPEPLALAVALEAAEGLQAVHAHGIVHRDLKPSNVMIDLRGTVRLMDFGIAKEAESASALTGSGQLMGTPEYMSPEQAQGGGVGAASDVYALGCMLYETLTGSPPFRGDSPVHTLYRHAHDEPGFASASLRALPPPVAQVLRRTLSKPPADRPSAAEVASALRHEHVPRATAADLAAAARSAAGPPTLRALAATPPPGPPTRSASDEAQTPTTTLRHAPAGSTRVRHGVAVSPRWRWAFVGTSLFALAVLLGTGSWLREPGTTPDVMEDAGALSPPPTEAAPAFGPGAGDPVLEPEREPTPAAPPVSPPRPPTAGPTSPPASRARAADVRLPEGMLVLVIVPPAEVTLDGVSLGVLSRREVAVPAGAHVVRILHPDYKPLQRKVRIEENETERLVLDLSEKAIRREP